MQKINFVLATTLAAVFCSAPGWTQDKKDVPIQINGDSVEYFYEKQHAVAKGNVRIEHKGSILTADEMEVDLAKKEATARGNVELQQDGAIYTGDALVVDLETKSAEISQVTATVAPHYHARGKHVDKVGEAYYQIDEGFITTCDKSTCEDGKTPPYRIQSRQVLYYPDDKVVIHHAVIYIYKVPVFYLPLIVIPIVDIDHFPLQVQAGRRKEWGTFVLTKMRYVLDPSHRGNLLFDLREKQGVAGGVEHFYQTSNWGNGAVRFYTADDRCGSDDVECSRNSGHVSSEESRYRAQLRHRWQLTDRTAIYGELNKLSDEFIIQDFFSRDEYERIAFPDNYVSVIHSDDAYTLSVLNRFQLDDFIAVTERTPEIRFDTHTRPLGQSDFYFRQEVEGAHLNQRVKDEPDLHSEANRVDIRTKFSYVWKVAPWTITPFIASRETYYSRDVFGEDRDFVRWNLETGADVSTKFFKVYDYSTNFLGMDINQIRHVVTPNIKYFYQSNPTHESSTLYPFDAIDAVDFSHFVRFELENKLQTKTSEGGKRNLVRTVISTDLLTPALNRTRLENILLDIEYYPYTWLTFSSNAAYRYETDQFDTANFDMVLRKGPVWVGFGHRYANEVGNQSTAQLEWQINDDLKVELYERFEFDDGETDEFEATLEIRNFLCWTARVTYNFRNPSGNSVYVSFSPTAFPDSAYHPQQTYHPDDPALASSR